EQGYINKEIIMGIRPEDLHDAPVFTGYTFDAKIQATELLGAETLVYSQIAGQPFIARLDSQSGIKQGQVLRLAIDMNKAHFFDYQTKKRIPVE
ncbi:MAG: TOBE domain-containing protein, partial [Thermoactinomyces sp.]